MLYLVNIELDDLGKKIFEDRVKCGLDVDFRGELLEARDHYFDRMEDHWLAGCEISVEQVG